MRAGATGRRRADVLHFPSSRPSYESDPAFLVTAQRERSDLSNSSTDPGFVFECLSPRRAIFDTVNAPYPTRRVNFSAGRGRASRERDGLALNVSIMLDYI